MQNKTGSTVLPPISSEADKNFLLYLDDFIECELKRLCYSVADSSKHRFLVYKQSFDQLIYYVSAYQSLLSSIKVEYEDYINVIKQGQMDVFYLTGKVKSMATEKATISNYRRRIVELEERISLITADNEQLRQHINYIITERKRSIDLQQKSRENVSRDKKIQEFNPNLPIKGLSLEQSTDLIILKKNIKDLELKMRSLCLSKETRYKPMEYKDELKQQLSGKIQAMDRVSEVNQLLKARCLKLKLALDALKLNYRDNNRKQSAFEIITNVFTKTKSKMNLSSQEVATSFDDDDPTKEKEAELLLDYIEHFNDLFESKKYIEAAMHAVNSPKGILRNAETMERFKALNIGPGEKSPLLSYCEVLIDSAPAVGAVPDAATSFECVKCALKEEHLDLVFHWIAQQRITFTDVLGNALYNYAEGKNLDVIRNVMLLAEKVYTNDDAHVQACVCMCRQGRILAMIEYAKNKEFSKDAFLAVLTACPSRLLAEEILKIKGIDGKVMLYLGTVVQALLSTDSFQIGSELIQNIADGKVEGIVSLKEAVFLDQETSPESWLCIVASCQDCGIYDTALELLASITVKLAIYKAVTKNEEFNTEVRQDQG